MRQPGRMHWKNKSCLSARGRKGRRKACRYDHAGHGCGRVSWEPRGAAACGARRNGSRAAAGFEQQPRHCRSAARIRDGRSSRPGIAGARRARCAAHFPCGRGLSVVGGTKNLLEASRKAGTELFVYTSTVATIAVDRPEPPNEATDAKLEEMVGHYKRSKWMAEQEVREAARAGFPAVIAMPTTPVGPWDWKPTPTGKIILDFLNGKMPGYVETGLNFGGVEECAAGHLLVSEKGKVGERYLLGGENLTLKALLDRLQEITGLPAARLKIPHNV